MKRGRYEKKTMNFEWRRAWAHNAAIIGVALFLLSLVAQNVRFHEMSRRLVNLRREAIRIEEEKTRLALRKRHLSRPSRIRKIASEELGMITPPVTRIRNLPGEK
ncbi:MAG: hypothetical protein D6679_01900 [Candidatus Hydrogenedentota bacterium]|nr:MAG: hypothetical protein D6679_01900 [Candidatus Hydrogenedentota bacterium]